MAPKRAYRLQEFAAHTSAVNCLKIGRKSSGVMVTGGDDKKVNMWAIGKPQAILSLSGHQSPVECVTFDQAEEVVVAGAAGGTLKLWDLEEAKVVRTLTGHRSNCISVDFHPFGEFFASGSLDTNLKIWDIRRKGCIHTYKGHDRGVGVCKFSPDGKWVISGGQDGRVKLWDLTAGKLLKELPSHDGPVTCVEFHPNELLVATGSADRSVKFWDLETFDLVDVAGPEATGVRSMLFTPDGNTLLSGTAEFLKVWKWEPNRCCDTVDVSWTKLADLSTHENKLLGASIHNSFVGVWVVDLNRVEPFYTGAERGPGGGGTREVPERSGAAPVLLTGERGSAAAAAAAHHAKENFAGGGGGGLDRKTTLTTTHHPTPGGGAFGVPSGGGGGGDTSGAVSAALTAAVPRARLGGPRTAATGGGYNDHNNNNQHRGGAGVGGGGGTGSVPIDPTHIAIAREGEVERRVPLTMNAGFAAAHGIRSDPLNPPLSPPPIVVAKPPPQNIEPQSQSQSQSQSPTPMMPPPAEMSPVVKQRESPPMLSHQVVNADDAVGDDEDDVVIEEDLPVCASGDFEEQFSAMAAAVGVAAGAAGAGSGETSVPPSPPPPQQPSPTLPTPLSRPQSSRGRFIKPTDVAAATGGRLVDAGTGMSGTLERGAFDLNVLRSAALEAETEFVNPADHGGEPGGGGGGSGGSGDTLAEAMARLRSEREHSERGDGEATTVGAGTPPSQQTRQQQQQQQHQHQQSRAPHVTSARSSPVAGAMGLDFASFVPGANVRADGGAHAPRLDEEAVLARLVGPDGATVSGILAARLTSLQVTKMFWTKGDVRGVADALRKAGDPSVIVDVVRSALEAPQVASAGEAGGSGGETLLTLELASALLPLTVPLLQSPHGQYAEVALQFSRKVAGSFMPLLQQAPEALAALERGGIGVDLVGEERAARAGAARSALLSLREPLATLATGGGELAPRARELAGILDQL